MKSMTSDAPVEIEGLLVKAMPRIREATKADIPLLIDLIRRSFRDVAERFRLTPENCPSYPSFTSEAKVAEGFDKGGRFFIIDDLAQPAGCVGLMPDEPQVWSLARVAVLPSLRRRGFVEMLIRGDDRGARWCRCHRALSLSSLSQPLPVRRLRNPPGPPPYRSGATGLPAALIHAEPSENAERRNGHDFERVAAFVGSAFICGVAAGWVT